MANVLQEKNYADTHTHKHNFSSASCGKRLFVKGDSKFRRRPWQSPEISELHAPRKEKLLIAVQIPTITISRDIVNLVPQGLLQTWTAFLILIMESIGFTYLLTLL